MYSTHMNMFTYIANCDTHRLAAVHMEEGQGEANHIIVLIFHFHFKAHCQVTTAFTSLFTPRPTQ